MLVNDLDYDKLNQLAQSDLPSLGLRLQPLSQLQDGRVLDFVGGQCFVVCSRQNVFLMRKMVAYVRQQPIQYLHLTGIALLVSGPCMQAEQIIRQPEQLLVLFVDVGVATGVLITSLQVNHTLLIWLCLRGKHLHRVPAALLRAVHGFVAKVQ